MKINPRLAEYDPSRYVVYQMLSSTQNLRSSILIQQMLSDVYLFKTEPFTNSLYNYAHVLSETLSEKELAEIRDFFGKNPFRIKIFENETLKQFLLSQGFSFHDTGNIMIAQNLDTIPPDNNLGKQIEIKKVTDHQGLNDYKSIFAEAFTCSIADTDKKFGFLDKVILDPNDNRMNVFVLYENGIPASTGAYYAFDMISIENIGTPKQFRGKGYAHEIMKCLLREAKELGYKKACLVASDAGARVYQNVGFENVRKTNTFVPIQTE